MNEFFKIVLGRILQTRIQLLLNNKNQKYQDKSKQKPTVQRLLVKVLKCFLNYFLNWKAVFEVL